MDGKKDMRSLASVYFILRWIAIFIFEITPVSTALVLVAIMYVSYGTVIALVRPYKKTYMNIIDTLIIQNLALLGLMTDKYLFQDANTLLALFYAINLSFFSFLPLLGLTGFIAYRILKRISSELHLFRTKKHTFSSRKPTAAISRQDLHDEVNDIDQELPDRMLHPQQYALDINSFESVDYERAS